jgi:hypothetical protein
MKIAKHLFCVRLLAAASLFIFGAVRASAQSDYTAITVENGGTITGTVKWSGPTPKVPKLPITKDASVCDPESHKVATSSGWKSAPIVASRIQLCF